MILLRGKFSYFDMGRHCALSIFSICLGIVQCLLSEPLVYLGAFFWVMFFFGFGIAMGIACLVNKDRIASSSLTLFENEIKYSTKNGSVTMAYSDIVSITPKRCIVTINDKIKICYLVNRDEVLDVIEKRRNGIEVAPIVTNSIIRNQAPNNNSCADEILKLKKLLDDGIITQEEFDKKKKELLG